MCDEVETWLLLKYGSIENAYAAYTRMTHTEQNTNFNLNEYQVLMSYEFHYLRDAMDFRNE